MSRGSSSRSKGCEWKYILYFTKDAKNPGEGEPEEISDENLISYFLRLGTEEEKILEVHIFKQNLFTWFPQWFGAWHEFTVVESTNFYWSFEKDSDGICVQRSKSWNSVKEAYRGTKRNNVRPEGRDSRRGRAGDTVLKIFKWIYRQDYLNKGYHVTQSNCHYFASRIFNAIAHRSDEQLDK